MQQREIKRHNKLNALQLLDLMGKDILKKGELDQHTRRVIVEYLHAETDKTQTEIAQILGVSRWTIIRDLDFLENCAVRALAPLSTQDYAKRIRARADRLIQRARAKGMLALEWRIEKETTQLLGRMGVIDFRFGMLDDDENARRPAGDVVLGDKNVLVVNQHPARSAAMSLTAEGRQRFLKALEMARLPVPDDGTIKPVGGTIPANGETITVKTETQTEGSDGSASLGTH